MKPYQNLFDLTGKKALVIGGTGGLGGAIAQAFLENGVDVAVGGRNPEKAAHLASLAHELGRNYLGVSVDVTDSQSVDAMMDILEEKFGPIDILVNSAGMNKLQHAEDYDQETFEKVMGLNVTGTHLVTKAVGARMMIPRRYGRIINISSVRGTLGMPENYIAYCASKGAVNMYTKQIACEWAKYGITSNAIAPTFVRTPINAFQLDDPVFYDKLVKRIPLGRIGQEKDIAAAALYLASDGASFVTGQILGVDGGLTVTQ